MLRGGHCGSFGKTMNVLKYAIIGGLCTVADFTIFLTLTNLLGIHYLLASTVSFSVAVFLNYYLCINFLFTAGIRFSKTVEIVSFFGISAIGLLIHQFILFSAVDLAHLGLILSKVIATGVVFSWNYLGRKWFVFHPPQKNN